MGRRVGRVYLGVRVGGILGNRGGGGGGGRGGVLVGVGLRLGVKFGGGGGWSMEGGRVGRVKYGIMGMRIKMI